MAFEIVFESEITLSATIHVHIVLIIRFALQRYELFCKPQDFHLLLFIRAQAHTKHIYPIYIKGASECRVLLFLLRFRKA